MRRKYKYQVVAHPMVPILRRRKISPARGGVTAIPTVSHEQIAQLKERYTFRREEEVVQFLRRYPFLVEVLMEASEVIPRYFEKDMGIENVLEVEVDYEDPTYVMLFLVIEVRNRWDEAYECERKFSYGWGLSAIKRAQCKICISLEHSHV